MRLIASIDRAARIWALFGGAALLFIVFVTVLDVLLGGLFSRPLASSYEIVVIGAGIAVFAFLPYAQRTRAHVRVNLAARFMPPWMQRLSDACIALIFAGFAGVLIWRMSLGAFDYYRYGEITPILGFPIWWAFVPVLFSLCLWAASAMAGFWEDAGFASPRSDGPEQ